MTSLLLIQVLELKLRASSVYVCVCGGGHTCAHNTTNRVSSTAFAFTFNSY